ncbi:MAG: DUF432 domain-containing protein [bacterium]|nr:DUF432 domain-containing protein [bacterium]
MSKKSVAKTWETVRIESGKLIKWRLGPLFIWCKKINEELRVAHRILESTNTEERTIQSTPKNIDWMRFTLHPKFDKIHLVPAFPDRPVVIQPETIFKLTRDTSAKIYVRVPLWIAIELIGVTKTTLIEIPSVTLSNTWFGSFFDGRLCYWITSGAQRVYRKKLSRPYLAVCPILLTNNSGEELSVERICLQVSGLSLFFDGEQLWSDDVSILYKGAERGSQIEATGKPPHEAAAAKLIGQPRQPQKKSFIAKTFASLKDLPGLGIIIN